MAKPPARTSSSQDIQAFLGTAKAVAVFAERHPRLVFAIDATASREPTWAIARDRQAAMFHSAGQVAPLSIQLCYYRGFHEFRASPWLSDSQALAKQMLQVRCEGGHTQIQRLLRHALAVHRETPLRGLVFIGDALEESPDEVCHLAGQCGLRKLPLFVFQEGANSVVQRTFQSMARLSGGAWARFDQHSADTLSDLLGAVARYAAGGRAALENHPGQGAKLLLQQLKP
jgi:hypothetical protein